MAITKIQSNAFPPTIDLSNVDLTLGAGEVLTANIADANVTTAKIADGHVTHAKLHTDMDLSGKTVTLPTLDSLDVAGQFLVSNVRAQHQTRITAPLITGLASDGYISIFGDADATNGLYVKDDGKVGIGVTNPTAGLVVSNGSLQLTSFNNPTSGIGAELGWDGTKAVIQSYNRDNNTWQNIAYNANRHIFGQGRVTINGSGNEAASASGNFLTIGDTGNSTPSGLGIVRGETLGGGTGPYLDFYHGASGSTVSQHRIYSYSDGANNSKLYVSADHGNDVGSNNSQIHLRTSQFTTNIITKKQNTTYAKRNTTYYQSENVYSDGTTSFGSSRFEDRTFRLVLETTSNNHYQPVFFFPSNAGDDSIRNSTCPYGQTGSWHGEIDISFYGSQRTLDYGGTDSEWSTGYLWLEFDFAHWNAKPQYVAIKHYRHVNNRFIGGHYIPGTTSFILLYMWPGSYYIRTRASEGVSVWYPGIDASGTAYNSGSPTGLSYASFGHGSRNTYWDSNRDWTIL